MNIIIAALTFIGLTATVFGTLHLTCKALEYFYELRRTLNECRDALKRVEAKH